MYNELTKKIISLLLCCVMVLGFVPVNGSAAEAESLSELTAHYSTPAGEFPSNDELFAGYAESVLYGYEASTFASAAGNRLSGDEKLAYNALKTIIKQIASGQRSSATIVLCAQGLGYTPDVTVTFTESVYSFDLNILIDALLSDLAYELYWYDKTVGCSTNYKYYTSSGRLAYIEFKFTVAQAYRSSTYVANTSKTSAATSAAANARSVVATYASLSDYNKLVAYKQYICNAVSYNHAAVENTSTPYGDPWQMIHVFDNNPNTNVVCEGYSKAYQYLCEMSTFTGDTTCYSVGGYMNGGAHMWNIVTMNNKNYLVDITNSDSGTVGQNGGLFMVGGSGSPSSGYKVYNINYVYDTDTKGLWGTGSSSILYLSSSAYTPTASPCANGHKYGSYISDNNGRPGSQGTKSAKCSVCGKTNTVADTGVYLPDVKITSTVGHGTGNILYWNSVSGATLYQVYRLNGSSWELLANTGSTAYKDESAPVGVKCYYKVRARKDDLMSSMAVASVSATRAVPTVLNNVKITSINAHSTGNIIYWNSVVYATVYQVYRLNGSSWVLLTNTGSLAYKDTTAPVGVKCYYKIVARRGDLKSDIGTTVSASATRPGTGVNKLSNVTIDYIYPHSSGNIIYWSAVSNAKYYQIYRLNGSSWTLITNTSSTAYKDTTAPVGKTSYYKIVARNGNVMSDIGTTKSASATRPR